MTESGEYCLEEKVKTADTKGKKMASILGDTVAKELNGLKEKSIKSINRVLYSHTATLFCLESVIAKAAGVCTEDWNLIRFGKGKFVAAELKTLGSFVRKLKADYVSVGDHMTIHSVVHQSVTSKELSDGEMVRPGDRVGEIDFVKDVPILREDDNLFVFTRYLYQSAKKSLHELAKLCEENDPSVDNINVFHGTSHLAGPLAKRLGFDIYEIANPIKRVIYKHQGKLIAKHVAGNNLMWQEYQRNFKSPREAYISRNRLIELFGNGKDSGESN